MKSPLNFSAVQNSVPLKSRIVSFICNLLSDWMGWSHCQAHTGEAHCILAYRWGFCSLKDNCSETKQFIPITCLKKKQLFSRLKFIWMDVSSQTHDVCWANWFCQETVWKAGQRPGCVNESRRWLGFFCEPRILTAEGQREPGTRWGSWENEPSTSS